MKFYYIFCLEELNHVVVMRQYLLPCAVLCLVAQSCLTLCDPLDCSPPFPSVHGDSPGKNTGVGCMPSSRGSSQPKDLTQVSCTAGRFFTIWATRAAQEYWKAAYPYSRGTSWCRNWTGVSNTTGGSFISWATREAHQVHTEAKCLAQGERRESVYSKEQK